MAIVTKLTKDAKLKLGIKEGTNGSFVARCRKVTSEELIRDHNPHYSYII